LQLSFTLLIARVITQLAEQVNHFQQVLNFTKRPFPASRSRMLFGTCRCHFSLLVSHQPHNLLHGNRKHSLVTTRCQGKIKALGSKNVF